MTLVDCTDTNVGKWDYLNKNIPDLNYNKVKTDYRKGDNFVGDQQRSFHIFWAIKEHNRTGGIGLDIACGQSIAPFCLGTDYYAGKSHPQYGGEYYPHVKCRGEELPFLDNSIDFIVAHHSLEHMENIEDTLREWIRVIKPGSIIANVMPDKKHGSQVCWDAGHISELSAEELREILARIENIKILEFDTLDNHFSFQVVIEKMDPRETRHNDFVVNRKH